MTHHLPVAIVGGGQAGLAISHGLTGKAIDHLIFEKHRIGHAWRNQRWDSFCLVTPNWQCTLPGFPYAGDDPDGFMLRDEIVAYIEAYARQFNPPVREGVGVNRLGQQRDGTFTLATDNGDYTADQVVVATGGYHRPKIPAMAQRLPVSIQQIHSSEYKHPDRLPPGEVLVVGSGQSGCQIAEDLHLAGRRVHLCVGSAPRSPRRYRGRDVVAWLDDMGYYDLSVDEHPQGESVRHKTNHYLTGRDGGREIDLRQFALEGMALYGRLLSCDGETLTFKDDLAANLDQADAVADSIKRTIDGYIEKAGIDAPTEAPHSPPWHPTDPVRSLDCAAAHITTVIWCLGFDTDFSWVDIPVFNGEGYPAHHRGVTTVPGLYFVGLPWLYTWGSGRFSGIARDAAYLIEQIVAHRSAPAAPRRVNEVAIGS